MVLLYDAGSVYGAPRSRLWRYVESGRPHAEAHHHVRVIRRRGPEGSGEYRWTQPYRGRSTRFAMRWSVFPPRGIDFEVVGGPFRGSRFFLVYRSAGRRSRAIVLGEFRSPTVPPSRLAGRVREFFAREFEEDRAALRAWSKRAGRPGREERGRSPTMARPARAARIPPPGQAERAAPAGVEPEKARRRSTAPSAATVATAAESR